MRRFFWLCLLSCVFCLPGCGSGDQAFGGGPEPVADLQLRFDFPDARLPSGVARFEVFLFDQEGRQVRDVPSPRVDQLTLQALSVQTYLVRILYFDANDQQLGYSNQSVTVTLPGPTVLDVEILLTGSPPGTTTPGAGGTPVQLAFLVHPGTAASGTAQDVQVVALDAAGRQSPFSGSVSLTLSEGTGVLSGTTNAQASNGLADFSVLITGSGQHRLLATADGLASAQSVPFTIVDEAPVASSLHFVTAPATAVVGHDLGLQVEVLDQFGNRLATATNSIRLGGLTLNGTTTQSAVDGLAAFPSVSPAEAGSFQLTASSTGLPDASSALTVAAQVATSLRFVQVPTSAADGHAFAVQVEVLDQLDQRLDSTVPITLALSGGPAALRLTGTATQNAVAGLATFNVALADAAGTTRLVASSPGTASATSADITVRLNGGILYVTQSKPGLVTSYPLGRAAGPLLDGAATARTTVMGLSLPISVFIDTGADALWLADPGNVEIDVFQSASTSNGPANISFAAASFPRGITYDPANDRLYVSEQSLAQVDIYDDASTAGRSLRATLANFNREVRGLFYDPAADRLFVAVGQDNGTLDQGFVAVFDNVSALSGTVDSTTETDRTVLAGLQEPDAVFYESHTRRLYVGNSTLAFVPQVAVYANADTTDMPAQAALLPGDDVNVNFGGGLRGLAVDWERDELYVSDGFNGAIKIFANASQMAGSVTLPPVRALTGLSDVSGITLDLTRD